MLALKGKYYIIIGVSQTLNIRRIVFTYSAWTNLFYDLLTRVRLIDLSADGLTAYSVVNCLQKHVVTCEQIKHRSC